MYRFFVKQEQIDMEEKKIHITGSDVNHIKNVLRMRQAKQNKVDGIIGVTYSKVEEERIENMAFVSIDQRIFCSATIVHDAIAHLLENLEEAEMEEFLQELITPRLHRMFVTPKDVDETVKRLSYTISEGINIAMEA